MKSKIMIKKFKRIIRTGFLLVMILWCSSCKDFLDIVPDNNLTLEDYFSRKDMAWNTLTKIYSFLPEDHGYNSSWYLGDEWIAPLDLTNVYAINIMQGLQNTTTPQQGLWNGTGGGKHLYRGIRSANIFLDYIDQVEDMTDKEKIEWKAQAKFLKAYYHFLLLRQYGPIVIMDNSLPLDVPAEELFPSRSKVEDCFNFVIRLMDEAIPDLKEKAGLNDLGQVDRIAALAIKARVMLFRASPFWNGNRSYYEDFLDHDGQPFFPMDEKPEKWKDALDAVNAAIELCETNELGLYEYDETPYLYDREDFAENDKMKTLYDLRMLIVDPWNKEMVWGQTYDYTSNATLAAATNIHLPAGYDESGNADANNFAWQRWAASYRMVERYYTKNGLPINEDLTFDRNTMYQIINTPGVEEPEYASIRGFMQPGAETIKLYMDREPRFYANLGITGSYWRGQTVRIKTMMYAGSDGGYNGLFANDFFCTGIGLQKFVHPESKSRYWETVIRFPYPIIRMADIYLMKAEILNEYLAQPNSEVYEAINKVRRRAGIPDVEKVWSDAQLVVPEFLNKHLDKDGMREIILHERSIELAFEGSRFWDMHRHKKAITEFSSPIMGWWYAGFDAKTFFILDTKQSRRFLARDCLWPIQLNETNTNSNLIQNPGW